MRRTRLHYRLFSDAPTSSFIRKTPIMNSRESRENFPKEMKTSWRAINRPSTNPRRPARWRKRRGTEGRRRFRNDRGRLRRSQPLFRRLAPPENEGRRCPRMLLRRPSLPSNPDQPRRAVASRSARRRRQPPALSPPRWPVFAPALTPRLSHGQCCGLFRSRAFGLAISAWAQCLAEMSSRPGRPDVDAHL